VGEQIQRYLSSRLIPELRDPRLGFATVTAVDVSRDLRTARIFVTIYEADPVKRKAAMEALTGAAGRFRRELGRDLRLRFTPTLTFLEDESIERADRIERLIHEIHESGSEDAGEGDEDRPGGDESE